MAKGKKTGGRKKGTKNKFMFKPEVTAENLGIDPFELCLKYAVGDWQGAGFQEEHIFIEKPDGAVAARPSITPEMRFAAIKEACKYLYPTKQSTDIKVPEGIKIIVEDYTKK